jgi:hypothetical protein
MRGEWQRNILAFIRTVARPHFRRCAVGIVVISGVVAWLSTDTHAALVKVNTITSEYVGAELLVTITASGPIRYELIPVQLNWIVFDIPDAELGIPAGTLPLAKGPLQKVRVGQPSPNTVRVVLELMQPINFRVSTTPDQKTIMVGIPGGPTGGAQGGGDPGLTQGAEPRPAPRPAPRVEPPPPQPAPRVEAPPPQPAPRVPPPPPQPAPRVEAPPPQPAPRAGAPTWLVVPGKSIGPIKLGMDIAQATKLLGPPASSSALQDGSYVYRWFAPPKNVGMGVRATKAGKIYRIWALNDPKYMTRQRLHAGSTEAEVRAALGDPSRVVVDSSGGVKTLRYDSLGIWIDIQLDNRYTFYNSVFSIGVM